MFHDCLGLLSMLLKRCIFDGRLNVPVQVAWSQLSSFVHVPSHRSFYDPRIERRTLANEQALFITLQVHTSIPAFFHSAHPFIKHSSPSDGTAFTNETWLCSRKIVSKKSMYRTWILKSYLILHYSYCYLFYHLRLTVCAFLQLISDRSL